MEIINERLLACFSHKAIMTSEHFEYRAQFTDYLISVFVVLDSHKISLFVFSMQVWDNMRANKWHYCHLLMNYPFVKLSFLRISCLSLSLRLSLSLLSLSVRHPRPRFLTGWISFNPGTSLNWILERWRLNKDNRNRRGRNGDRSLQ